MIRSRTNLLFLCLAVALSLPVPTIAGTDPTDAPEVVAHAGYSGEWTPDEAANAKLAKQLRKQMRSRMEKMRPPASPPRGGMGGGMPGGGGVQRGGMGGGMPPDGPPPGGMPEVSAPTAVGLLKPEMDFAAPLQGDLVILHDEGMVALGNDSGNPVILPIGRGATELGDGLTALAMQSSDGLVVEFQTADGAVVTHTYSLESGGARLRIRTHVAGSQIPIPGGMDLERVYNRVQAAATP